MQHLIENREVFAEALRVAEEIESIYGDQSVGICGVPVTGIAPVYAILVFLPNACLVKDPFEADVIVDAVLRNGVREREYSRHFPHADFRVLFDLRTTGRADDPWIVFPWERADVLC